MDLISYSKYPFEKSFPRHCLRFKEYPFLSPQATAVADELGRPVEWSLRQGSTTSFRAPTSVAECPKWMSSNWLFSCTMSAWKSCTNHPTSRVTSRTPSCSASSTSLIVRRTPLSTFGVRTFPLRVCGRLCHRISFPTCHFLFSAQSPEDFLSLILLTYLFTYLLIDYSSFHERVSLEQAAYFNNLHSAIATEFCPRMLTNLFLPLPVIYHFISFYG